MGNKSGLSRAGFLYTIPVRAMLSFRILSGVERRLQKSSGRGWCLRIRPGWGSIEATSEAKIDDERQKRRRERERRVRECDERREGEVERVKREIDRERPEKRK